MKHLVFLVVIVAAGCSKSAPDCASAIGKGMDNFAEQMKTKAPGPMQAAMSQMAGKLKETLIKRCTEDKWPAEVVNCFNTVSDRPGMQACQQKLSEEQREKLMADIRQTMMGQFGGGMKMPGGMAGHPPMLGGSAAAGSAAPESPPAPAPAPAGSAAPSP